MLSHYFKLFTETRCYLVVINKLVLSVNLHACDKILGVDEVGYVTLNSLKL